MDLLISGGVVLLAIVLLSVYAVYLFLVRFFHMAQYKEPSLHIVNLPRDFRPDI